MQCHRCLSSGESFLKLIDARLFPSLSQGDPEAVQFPRRSVLRPEFLCDPEEFISISFAGFRKDPDCYEDLGDRTTGMRRRYSMLNARLKAVAKALQLLAN